MMRSPIFPTLVGLLVTAGTLGAQDNFSTAAGYAVSLPTGGTRGFVGSPSWAGITYEARWATSRHSTAVLGASLHDFASSSFGTTNFPSGAATGEQTRDLMAANLIASARYYPTPAASHRPYVSLGAGAMYTEQFFQLGLSQFQSSNTSPAIVPEIGLEMPYMDMIDAVVALRYTMPLGANRHIGGGTGSFQFFTISVGLIER